MTENLQVYDVQSLLTCFVRCCPKCHISIDLVHKEHKIRVGLWIVDSKELFDYFYSHKEEIEESAEVILDWDKCPLPGKIDTKKHTKVE